eukprot:Hpha_TRINITY_DN27802_c0_g1::TRINITY_DN27802_c0_g1_i1::g.194024::m.194024
MDSASLHGVGALGSSQPITYLALLQRFVVVGDIDWGLTLWDLATREQIHKDLAFQSRLGEMRVASVPVLAGGSLEEKRRLVAAGLPFIDQDAAADWKALDWTLDTFRTPPLGSVAVPVTFPSRTRKFSTCDRTREFELGCFVNSFEELTAAAERQQSPPPYLRAWSFERAGWGELRNDYTPPEWAQDFFDRLRPEQRPEFRWLFIGPKGARTPLHVDPCLTHAWLTQLVGSKKWVMVPPADVPKVVDKEGFADMDAPDKDRFPLSDEAERVEFVLEAGQTIFIPHGWAHQVVSLEPGVSLTHNFLPKDGFSLVRMACLKNIVTG